MLGLWLRHLMKVRGSGRGGARKGLRGADRSIVRRVCVCSVQDTAYDLPFDASAGTHVYEVTFHVNGSVIITV